MTIIRTSLLALTLGAVALPGATAFANGGGGDIAQQREKLQAEIRAARAADQANCQTAALWQMMFGHDDQSATAEAAVPRTAR